MAVVAITSVVFTDVLQWFRLHRLLANIAMLVAAFFSLREFIGVDSHQKLLAIANLMVYVQIIMLYQEKKTRLYGHLIIFSLLQIVVGTLLSQRFEFIGILSIYMVAALFSLSLLSLLRQLAWLEKGNRPRRRPSKAPSIQLPLVTTNTVLSRCRKRKKHVRRSELRRNLLFPSAANLIFRQHTPAANPVAIIMQDQLHA